MFVFCILGYYILILDDDSQTGKLILVPYNNLEDQYYIEESEELYTKTV